MTTGRLEAFSDAVIAIVITVMLLELKVPHGGQPSDLRPLLTIFLSYVLSFFYVGIYWSNHHHLLHTCRQVTAAILWSNLHLLFWLSLLPFAAGWAGVNSFKAAPTALYAAVLLMAGISYHILQLTIIRAQGRQSTLKNAIGRDWKGKLSLLLYVAAILLTSATPRVAWIPLVIAAMVWLVPDRRLERLVSITNV